MSDNGYQERLNKIKELHEQKQTEKTKAETNMENLLKQEKQTKEEVEAMGVKPEELQKKINGMDAEIEEMLSKAKQELEGNPANGESNEEVTEDSISEQAV